MKSYVLKYSEWDNRMLVVKYAIFFLFATMIALIFLIWLNIIFNRNEMSAIIYIFAGTYIFTLSTFQLPGYFSSRNYLKDYEVTVTTESVFIKDSRLNLFLMFNFRDIIKVTSIYYGMTNRFGYQLEIVGGKQLLVNNSMTNFRVFEKDLMQHVHFNIKRSFKPVGSHIENIL